MYTTVPGNVLGLNLHEFRNNRDNPQSIKATRLKISYTQGFCVYRYYEVVLETNGEKFKILSYLAGASISSCHVSPRAIFNIVKMVQVCFRRRGQ